MAFDLIKQHTITSFTWQRCGEKLVTYEDRVCASQQAHRLQFLTHLIAPRRQSNIRRWEDDTCNSDPTHEIEAVDGRRVTKRRAGYRHELIDRDRFWMRREFGQFDDQVGAIFLAFTHAQDGAATHLHAGAADVSQCVEPILISAR